MIIYALPNGVFTPFVVEISSLGSLKIGSVPLMRVGSLHGNEWNDCAVGIMNLATISFLCSVLDSWMVALVAHGHWTEAILIACVVYYTHLRCSKP